MLLVGRRVRRVWCVHAQGKGIPYRVDTSESFGPFLPSARGITTQRRDVFPRPFEPKPKILRRSSLAESGWLSIILGGQECLTTEVLSSSIDSGRNTLLDRMPVKGLSSSGPGSSPFRPLPLSPVSPFFPSPSPLAFYSPASVTLASTFKTPPLHSRTFRHPHLYATRRYRPRYRMRRHLSPIPSSP